MLNVNEFYDGVIDSAVVDERGGYLRLNFKLIVEGETRYNNIFLTSRDGALKIRVLEHIRTWAKGWDGGDPFDLPQAIQGLEVRVKIGEREWNGKTYCEDGIFAKNANGGGMTAISEADKNALRAKYGAKFRAWAGSTPKPVSASMPVKQPLPPTPKADMHKYTMDECFDAFTETLDHPYNNGSDDNDEWFAILDSVREGLSDNQTTATSDDWREVMKRIKGIKG